MQRHTLLIIGSAALVAGCGDAESLLGNAALRIRGRTTAPYLQMDAPDSVIVSWFTPTPMVGEVEVIETPAGDPQVRRLTEEAAREHHQVRVEGFNSEASYSYRLVGRAATDDQTRPLPVPKGAGQPVSFAVLGDSGRGTPQQYAVAEQMAAASPDYVIHTGDVVYPRGADVDYDAHFFAPYTDLLDGVVIFPCLGNHDVGLLDGEAYLSNFILPENGPAGLAPERWYSIDLGDVHLASIDGNAGPDVLADRVIPWLRDDLAATPATWRFVVMHFPVYTSGTPTRQPDPADQAVWGGLFDDTGVDVSFTGHNHFYERTLPIRDGQVVAPGEGTVYVVSGNGGASLYPLALRAPYSAAATDETFGFTWVGVDGPRITIRHVDQDGGLRDEVTWTKDTQTP